MIAVANRTETKLPSRLYHPCRVQQDARAGAPATMIKIVSNDGMAV